MVMCVCNDGHVCMQWSSCVYAVYMQCWSCVYAVCIQCWSCMYAVYMQCWSCVYAMSVMCVCCVYAMLVICVCCMYEMVVMCVCNNDHVCMLCVSWVCMLCICCVHVVCMLCAWQVKWWYQYLGAVPSPHLMLHLASSHTTISNFNANQQPSQCHPFFYTFNFEMNIEVDALLSVVQSAYCVSSLQ